jgi:hypothetical protein
MSSFLLWSFSSTLTSVVLSVITSSADLWLLPIIRSTSTALYVIFRPQPIDGSSMLTLPLITPGLPFVFLCFFVCALRGKGACRVSCSPCDLCGCSSSTFISTCRSSRCSHKTQILWPVDWQSALDSISHISQALRYVFKLLAQKNFFRLECR